MSVATRFDGPLFTKDDGPVPRDGTVGDEFQSICRAVRSSGEAAHREQTADVGAASPCGPLGKIAFSNGAREFCSRMTMEMPVHRCSRPEIASFPLNHVVGLTASR